MAEPAGSDITVTGASLIEMSPAQPAGFEVMQANPGLCAVLENAALLYARGQTQPRANCSSKASRPMTPKLSPLAWLSLFDLMQRANGRNAFDQLAPVRRTVRALGACVGEAARKSSNVPGGYVPISGKLTGVGQIEGLKRAIDEGAPMRASTSCR
jgi:hypothetical protein